MEMRCCRSEIVRVEPGIQKVWQLEFIEKTLVSPLSRRLGIS